MLQDLCCTVMLASYCSSAVVECRILALLYCLLTVKQVASVVKLAGVEALSYDCKISVSPLTLIDIDSNEQRCTCMVFCFLPTGTIHRNATVASDSDRDVMRDG